MFSVFLTLGALCFSAPADAASSKLFVEFIPQNQNLTSAKVSSAVSTKGTRSSVSAVSKPNAEALNLSEKYIKSLISETLNQMVADGVFKGEKGQKSDSSPGYIREYDPEAVGFQPIVIAGSSVGPDVGTFFAATSLSSDILMTTSLEAKGITAKGTLSVVGDADFQGTIDVATASIASLNVGNLTSDSGAYLSPGGDWVNASSKMLKENFSAVDSENILSKINSLPIYTWNYKSQSASTIHIGPLAEDFYTQFGVGGEVGSRSISTIDPAGVALVGIQGLSRKLESLLDFSPAVDYLKKLGIEIKQGIINVKEFVANSVMVQTLKVGSPEFPGGMTMYDRITGQPVCVFIANGVLQSESGECETGSVHAQALTEDSGFSPKDAFFIEEPENVVEEQENKVLQVPADEPALEVTAVLPDHADAENSESLN